MPHMDDDQVMLFGDEIAPLATEFPYNGLYRRVGAKV